MFRSEKRAAWLSELRRIAEEVSQRAALSEAEAEALIEELRLLDASIRQSEQRLYEFETKYQWSTNEFISRFENDEIEETLEFSEWVGEYRLLERLREKATIIQGIKSAN